MCKLDLFREIEPGGVFTSNLRAMKLTLQYFNKVHQIGPMFNIDRRKNVGFEGQEGHGNEGQRTCRKFAAEL